MAIKQIRFFAFRGGSCACCIALLLSDMQATKALQVLVNYRYAFVTDYGIGFLDPSSPEQVATWYATTPPNSDKAFVSFTGAMPSPDGRWIALSIMQRSSPTLQVEVFNVGLGAAQPPLQVGNGFPSEWEILGWNSSAPLQEMVWSPNGRYLALNMYSSKQADIYLYSVYNGTLRDITALDPANHYRIAWSNDSDYIATSSSFCASDGQCAAKMEVFDTQGNLTYSVGVSDISCDLGWSPDNRYLYFQTTCNGLSWGKVELYLWPIGQNTIEQLTDFTTPFQSGNRAIPGAIYHVLWTDSHTILISAIIIDSKTGAASTRTVSYDTDARTLNTISNDLTQEWAVNPASGQIAFRRIAQADFDFYEPRNPTVHLGQINNAALSDVIFPQATQIGAGCDLQWSPDGVYLAYSLPQSCTMSYASGFGFMDTKTGSVRQHPFAADDQPSTDRAIRAGWVVVPGQFAGSQTPPPPVVLTPTVIPATSTPETTPPGLQD